MKTLENPSYTLTQLLDAGKAMELSKARTANIEDKQPINKLFSRHGNRKGPANSNQDGRHQADKRSCDWESRNSGHEDRKSRLKCRNCGGDYPHHGGKTSCPAYQATCRGCGKLDHFETVCRSKDKGESSNTRRSTVHKVSEEESSDEDEVYTFSLSTKASKDQPFFRIKVHGTPVTIMADSGTSIKILDEEYHRLPSRPNLEPSSVKIYGYQSKVPLRVLGKFTTALESETNKASDKLYVVEGSGGSLLSWKTSQELNLLQTVQQVGSTPSKPETKAPADLIEEYDDLFHGLGKLKDYQIRLHIDENVPPVVQQHKK